MGIEQLSDYVLENYEVHERNHACAILEKDFPSEWRDLTELLEYFKFYKSWITVGGGRKSKISNSIDEFLYARDWAEKEFSTSIKVDEDIKESPTHKIDCYKNRIAIEIEWNNKDPFYDRDLNNFRLLFDLRAISVGIIITRTDELQSIFDELKRGKSYGASTTHISKLLPKLDGGGSGGCPILIFGIKPSLYIIDC